MFALNIGFLRREIVYCKSMNNILSVRSDLWKLSVLAGSFDDNNGDDDDADDEKTDRVVEAVDDLGDPKDNSACMLVQTRAQPHLLLTMSMSFR